MTRGNKNMGMDLITVGFTVDTTMQPSAKIIEPFIADVLANLTEANLEVLDPSGAYDAEDIADMLRSGVDEYLDAVSAGRMVNLWEIPGTLLVFVSAGGGSWGDSPFEGFDELCLFVNACEQWPPLAEAAGFVVGGLPSAEVIARYAA